MKRPNTIIKNVGFKLLLTGSDISSDEYKPAKVVTYTIDKVKNDLLNPEIKFPEIFYKKCIQFDNKDILKNKRIKYNVYFIFSGVAGIEYIKTSCTFVNYYPRIVEVVSGSGIVIKQDTSSENTVVNVIKVKQNDKVIINPGEIVSITNNKSLPLVVAEVVSTDARIESYCTDSSGLAYYVISKNSKSEIVRNPKYKAQYILRKIDIKKINEKLSISAKTPILKQLLRKYEKFDWFFEKSA